jgi:putative CocE/NonD family hydrolase
MFAPIACRSALATLGLSLLSIAALAQSPYRFADHYLKQEYDIPMRDGVKLHVVVYRPKDVSGKHPILMERTCYGSGPYGPGFRNPRGSQKLKDNGYIFAFADVRGKSMSEGDYVNVRPELKPGEKGIDESTDTWDTVDFLVKNVPDNNGSVGLWGISYPGFYSGVGAINTHPALKAVSPQAPVSNWFKGDDVHHNGAFFVQDNFDFSTFFDVPRNGPRPTVNRGGKSAYAFFLDASTAEGLEQKYYQGKIPYWNELLDHPNYDQYWKDRSLPDHFRNVHCAVLTVGGWFDAEDQWGALNLFQYSQRQNRGIPNFLCMGPWYHGMWAAPFGTTFGDLNFGLNTSAWFQENVEFPFFEKYLRGVDVPAPAKATVFETGTNKWRTFPQWPPAGLGKAAFYLGEGNALTASTPDHAGHDAYVNDPANPTPYLADFATSTRRTRTYMIDDQRWADGRSDVLSYRGTAFDKDLTVAGPIDVDFWVSTTGTDADLVVKVIDVWPADAAEKSPTGASMANYEQNLKADIMRCRFRDSLEHPKPFVPGTPTRVHFHMNDLLHTFKKGHRLMVQVQSDWFPLVDRNPNTFVDVERAKPADFQKATITLYHEPGHASHITFGVLGAGG